MTEYITVSQDDRVEARSGVIKLHGADGFEGMAAAGRYLQVRLRAPDRPGSLATLLGVLAASEANVLEVEHVRTGVRLSVDEVEIALRLETQGPDHCRAVLAALRTAGFPLQV